MKIPRICKNCGDEFLAIKETQRWCSRQCFKRSYYQEVRAREEEALKHPVFPKKRCGFCGNLIQLDFDPIRQPALYEEKPCPFCSATNLMIWHNSYLTNSAQIISGLIEIRHSIATRQQKNPD